MKKVFIAMAILAAAVFSSCNREIDIDNGYVPLKNGLAFYLQGVATTKSAETNPVVKVYDLENVNGVVLEESVVSLDENWFYAPATKGTPAYTENVADLYGSFNAVAYKEGTTTLALDDAEFIENNGMWEHSYDIIDPFANGALHFFMRMPAATIDAQGSNFDYKANGNIEFDYESPATASEQKDILFTSRSLSKEEYTPKTGAPLLFHHALTGVKFRVKNSDDEIEDMDIVITKVEFDGFQTSGHCTIVPDKEDNYKDNTSNYSSATAVTWSTTELEGKTSINISEEFDGMIDYSSETTSLPDHFYAKDGDNNLNDASASKTFWIIPQKLTTGKTITIHFEMNGIKEQYFVLDVDKLKSDVEWKAGQLRTYTFKLNEVNVKIDDTVTIKGDENDAYSASVKNNVTITNTGNTDAFIRAAVVGQWWSKKQGSDQDKPEVVFGFTDAVGRLDVVESWYEDQFVSTATPAKHGTFVGLPGYKGAPAFKPDAEGSEDGWVLCKDNYYYYTKPVAANGTTTALFDSYTLGTPPTPTYGGQVWTYKDIYFTLEIATQAISANNLDGSHKVWDAAWEEATTIKPEMK